MKKAFGFCLKYWRSIIFVFALLLIQAWCDLALPEYMSKILAEGVAGQNSALVWRYGGIMLGYAFGVCTASVTVGYLSARIGAGVSRDIRAELFSRTADFSGAEFDRFGVSTLITRATNDVTQIQMFLIMLIRIALYSPIAAAGGIFKALKTGGGAGGSAWIIAVGVGALLTFIAVLLLTVQPKFLRLQKLTDKINLLARERLNGMTVIRAFGTGAYERGRFGEANTALTDTSLFVNRVMSLLFPVINLIMYGIMAAVIWLTAKSAVSAQSVADMTAFIQYAATVIMSFLMLTMIFVLFPRAVVSAKRVGEVLSTERSVKDSPGAADIDTVTDGVEFRDVTFSYPNSEAPVLSGVSFRAELGQTTAIIGSTGSGKSTLVSLIPRLYDPGGGEVLFSGRSVKDITLRSLRKNVAFVPQKATLFSGTVKSNILFGGDGNDGGGEDARMLEAAEISQSAEFIGEKSGGFDEPIDRGGANVSGGQKQRLAVARALAKNAPVIVFDDSFSALDFKTDSALRAALRERCKSAAVIAVAQRVGTIMSADKIIVLDGGRLAGEGTHGELMKTCAVYADIAKSQLSEEELNK
ncbi:MAG: ABC transporter ATP-binding protein/permease [Clostridiales bacterium]|jgi:ATP-binding cassette subfamily B protein|nr:ABC transporter ATP-binding protein/permease [Clostridiales bacterium]